MTATRVAPRLGLRANAAQFLLLVTVNALVGGLLGTERTVLPLLGEREFHLTAYTAALTYIIAFGPEFISWWAREPVRGGVVAGQPDAVCWIAAEAWAHV